MMTNKIELEKRGRGEWETEEPRFTGLTPDEVPSKGNGRRKNFIFVCVAAKLNIMKIIRSHKELVVYQMAFKSSMELFHLTKSFPKEEVYSLTSQIRRRNQTRLRNPKKNKHIS